MKRTERKDEALRAFVAHPQMTASLLHEVTGWDRAIARATLGNVKRAGYVTSTRAYGKDHDDFALTPKGVARLKEIEPADDSKVDVDLERHAFDLVVANPNGRDSGSLAEELGCTSERIEQLLALHVEQHRLVTCGVWRGGLTFLQYRASAGSSLVFDWSAQRLSATTSAQKMLPITPPPAAAPEPSLRQQIAAKEKATKVSAPAPITAQPATNKEPITFPSPSAGWGKLLSPGDTVNFPEGALKLEVTEGNDGFLCYVDSDGDTYIHSNGEQIELPIEHTRKLMRYFALINAASMLIEPAGAAA